MFHHIPFQDFIIVWVYLMNWLTGNYPELVCQHGCRSVMARHSSQTDKLLCCQSDHQTKQIVKVINGKKYIKYITTSNAGCIFFSTQLLYNYPHLHAMLLNHPN